jgi:hypothetical protein
MSGYELNHFSKLIADFGFPMVALLSLGFFIWHIWNWMRKDISPKITEAGSSFSKLSKQVEALDNDLIRLNVKLRILLKEHEKLEKLEKELIEFKNTLKNG